MSNGVEGASVQKYRRTARIIISSVVAAGPSHPSRAIEATRSLTTSTKTSSQNSSLASPWLLTTRRLQDHAVASFTQVSASKNATVLTRISRMAVQLYNATSNNLEPLTPTLDSDPATNLNFESPSSTAAELALFQAILDSNPVNTSTLEPTTDFALWNALLESTAMSNLTPEYIQSARSADVSTESVFPELPGNLGTEFFDSAVLRFAGRTRMKS
ncbi:hypothetical protein C8J57DRAFT_1478496 [Mycena rebaudengoi]|nr:hypothetical protein C8J57DRAFT_1478496 [Mycena rebaudengoi]